MAKALSFELEDVYVPPHGTNAPVVTIVIVKAILRR
jgi:hypothetical protein